MTDKEKLIKLQDQIINLHLGIAELNMMIKILRERSNQPTAIDQKSSTTSKD